MTNQQAIAICASQMLAANAEYIRLQQAEFKDSNDNETLKITESQAIAAAKRIFKNS